MAKIFMRDYIWKIILWKNFIFCRFDKRSKEEVMDNLIIDQDDYTASENNEENSLKSIFLYNKVKV